MQCCQVHLIYTKKVKIGILVHGSKDLQPSGVLDGKVGTQMCGTCHENVAFFTPQVLQTPLIFFIFFYYFFLLFFFKVVLVSGAFFISSFSSRIDYKKKKKKKTC